MKVKVLYLLPYFNLAGTETHVVELAKALKKDPNILVAAPKGIYLNLHLKKWWKRQKLPMKVSLILLNMPYLTLP